MSSLTSCSYRQLFCTKPTSATSSCCFYVSFLSARIDARHWHWRHQRPGLGRAEAATFHQLLLLKLSYVSRCSFLKGCGFVFATATLPGLLRVQVLCYIERYLTSYISRNVLACGLVFGFSFEYFSSFAVAGYVLHNDPDSFRV